MKIFIMWSGPESRTVAMELTRFLESVLQGPHYFVSDQDINAGEVWDQVLIEKLESSNIGIACLTKLNLESTWIHLEAGAISKASKDSRVIPYMVGFPEADYKGPLTRFQAKKATREGTRAMVADLFELYQREVDIGSGGKIEAVTRSFDAQWTTLAQSIETVKSKVNKTSATSNTDSAPVVARPADDLLNEVVARIRSLERTISSISKSSLAQASLPEIRRLQAAQQAYEEAMRHDLRSLVVAQEAYFADHSTYSRSLKELDFVASPGVIITVSSVSDVGWSATAAHTGSVETFGIQIGGTAGERPEGQPFRLG